MNICETKYLGTYVDTVHTVQSVQSVHTILYILYRLLVHTVHSKDLQPNISSGKYAESTQCVQGEKYTLGAMNTVCIMYAMYGEYAILVSNFHFIGSYEFSIRFLLVGQ